MSEPRFVHLRVHSDYSMIDGLAKTAPLVKKAAALGMPALAITDFTNLCGLVKFYGAGHGAGIKPIVGADFNVQCDLLGDELTHLTVLAANNTGYQNLTLLISKAYQRGYGAAGPIIDRDWLIELNEGLILLSGGRMGDVGRSLLRGNSALVDECVAFYEEHFPDRYFLELIRTGRPDEESYLHAAVELAEARGHGGGDVFVCLKAAWADAGADGCADVVRMAAKLLHHSRHRPGGYPGSRSAPTGMGSSHGLADRVVE